MNQKEKPNIHDYRDIYVGYTDDEIIEKQKEFYFDENKPHQKKFKPPKYKNNKIKTSKYNLLNFLPKSLLFQFLRFYNFYFLATVVLQGIPAVSTMPVYLAALPFIFVLGVSIVREAYEDIKRKRQDRLINNTKTLALQGNKFHEVKWAQLKPGDIVLVHEDETFPTDMLLLECSDHFGTSYIQTTTLDGERALKPRQSFVEIKHQMKEQ